MLVIASGPLVRDRVFVAVVGRQLREQSKNLNPYLGDLFLKLCLQA